MLIQSCDRTAKLVLEISGQGPLRQEDAEGTEEEGQHWNDKALRWAPLENKGNDGYTLIASRMLAQLDLEGEEELS